MAKLLNLAGIASAIAVTAGAASAATVTLTGAGPDVPTLSGATGVGSIGYTITPSGTGIGNDTVLVSQNVDGVGVNGFTVGEDDDTEPGLIDGSFFSTESLTVTFDSAVDLDSFTLGSFSTADFDDYTLAINGLVVGTGLTSATLTGFTNVTSFTITAEQDLLSDYIGNGLFGNDEFTLAAFDVSAVPLPAAGVLLLAALGGLGLARRRAKA